MFGTVHWTVALHWTVASCLQLHRQCLKLDQDDIPINSKIYTSVCLKFVSLCICYTWISARLAAAAETANTARELHRLQQHSLNGTPLPQS